MTAKMLPWDTSTVTSSVWCRAVCAPRVYGPLVQVWGHSEMAQMPLPQLFHSVFVWLFSDMADILLQGHAQQWCWATHHLYLWAEMEKKKQNIRLRDLLLQNKEEAFKRQTRRAPVIIVLVFLFVSVWGNRVSLASKQHTKYFCEFPALTKSCVLDVQKPSDEFWLLAAT